MDGVAFLRDPDPASRSIQLAVARAANAAIEQQLANGINRAFGG